MKFVQVLQEPALQTGRTVFHPNQVLGVRPLLGKCHLLKKLGVIAPPIARTQRNKETLQIKGRRGKSRLKEKLNWLANFHFWNFCHKLLRVLQLAYSDLLALRRSGLH
jgi:hypothetical protein